MLSIVIPIYNEVENVPELHAELQGVLVALGRPYEIIYVDDGSRDGSFCLRISSASRAITRVRSRRS